MTAKYFCPIWGMKHLPLNSVLQQIKAAGYDGAEIALDPDILDIFAVKQLFEQHQLLLLAQLPYPKAGTVANMRSAFLSKLEALFAINPLMINCHTGKDYFTFNENLEFIIAADELSKQYRITVTHETHRGRFAFTPQATLRYLKAFPDLKLTADFSHWCVVSESLLEDQQETIDQLVPNCVLIHARVGHSQSAQVTHPFDPYFQSALQQHTRWWQQISDHHQQQQKDLLITCEFGPPPYMPIKPFTHEPLANQFELNLLMKDYLTKNLIV